MQKMLFFISQSYKWKKTIVFLKTIKAFFIYEENKAISSDYVVGFIIKEKQNIIAFLRTLINQLNYDALIRGLFFTFT